RCAEPGRRLTVLPRRAGGSAGASLPARRGQKLDGWSWRGYCRSHMAEPDDKSRTTTIPVSMRFWLEYRGHHFELRQGLMAIGRSASCQLVVDDALVSRRHAQIVVSLDAAT